MPHLTKNIVTALEYLGAKGQKRCIMFGKCPVNLDLIEDVWVVTDGLSSQMQATRLTMGHFDKNAFSRMNVAYGAQILSLSTATMVREAIADDDVVLALRNKNVYHHVANLCEKWNDIIDLCNGRDGPHSPENAEEHQKTFLDILSWFSK